MLYKIIPRQYSVVGFDDPRDPNFVTSAQIFVYGDKGFMYGVDGPRFYELMAAHGGSIFNDLGIASLEGYVVASHHRLMRMAIRRQASVRVIERGEMAGLDMLWVRVTPNGSIVDLLIESPPDDTLDLRTK